MVLMMLVEEIKEYTENKEMREEGKRRLTEKPIEIPNDVIDEV